MTGGDIGSGCMRESQSATVFSTPDLTLLEMFHKVHGHRPLHHGAKRTYLALCKRYPGHGVPLRVIQDMVAECPLCQKDRIPLHTVPSQSSTQTLLHHTRSIGIDHISDHKKKLSYTG